MNRREQRKRVMICLYQYMLTGRDLDDIFDENLDIDDKKSISFIVNNVVNTIENMDHLQKRIEEHLSPTWEYDRLGYIERAILLMSVQEIEEKETDKAVIINEAIEIAKIYCDDDAPKLINGVLDNYD